MTRKLFSLTLSAFALLLLMGAGVEEDSAGQIQTEKGPRGAQLVQASETHDQEADQAHMDDRSGGLQRADSGRGHGPDLDG